MHFGCVQYINIASAACTAIGTIVLYRGSFAYETMARYMNEKLIEETYKRNRKRLILQRSGVVLILAGLGLQTIAQFL